MSSSPSDLIKKDKMVREKVSCLIPFCYLRFFILRLSSFHEMARSSLLIQSMVSSLQKNPSLYHPSMIKLEKKKTLKINRTTSHLSYVKTSTRDVSKQKANKEGNLAIYKKNEESKMIFLIRFSLVSLWGLRRRICLREALKSSS